MAEERGRKRKSGAADLGSSAAPLTNECLHFVTGKLAANALREIVASLASEVGFEFSIDVLPITVAALMTPKWIARHVQIPAGTTRVIIPGYCGEDLAGLSETFHVPFESGPRDLRELPQFFGQSKGQDGYGDYDVQIIAEINHAPRLTIDEILLQAASLAADGADIIDVGCDPDGPWRGVSACVHALRDAGFRVSIDSLDPREIAPAVEAGAELVLSVNHTNREAAADWGCEVIVVPDEIGTLQGIDKSIECLDKHGISFRIDPILEPIGFGFADSLARYHLTRQRYPHSELMMGIGNLTELTDVDSAGVNAMLLGFCQEVGIRSVLTTQVINWARSSVRECDLARRLMHYSVNHQVVPKHLEPTLVCLRDVRVFDQGQEQLVALAADIRDHNVRIFAERGEIHALCDGVHVQDADPFVVFAKLFDRLSDRIDPSHAFYLGYEMCKALTALTLGKQYRQDEALDWGHLTRLETNHRSRR